MIKRIKWGNVGLAVLLVAGIGVLIHDFYMLSIYPFISGNMTGYSITGILTTLLIFIGVCEIGNKLAGE